MRTLGALRLLLLGTCLCCAQLWAADLYVATNGNDQWSGRLAAPNAQRTDGPFATLGRARDAVRARKQAVAVPAVGLVVEVLAGTYELPQTLALTQEDSGAEGAAVVYRGQPGAEVRLLGGRRVSGFVPAEGAVLKADLVARGYRELVAAGQE